MRLVPSSVARSSAYFVLLSSAYLVQQQPSQRIRSRAALVIVSDGIDGGVVQGSSDGGATRVTAMFRFAVKGLDADRLQHISLEAGGSFPFDRKWALHFDAAAERFSPAAPQWLHKANFLCAFTANTLMASFKTSFEDATRTLTVSRGGGGTEMLRADLDDVGGSKTCP